MLSALIALFLIAPVGAETNVTIDDTDPRVVYELDRKRLEFPGQRASFAVLRDDHSPLFQTAVTEDRINRTTHYTSVLGATASLTFTVECFSPLTVRFFLMPRLQGAIAVYYIGYDVKGVPPPLLIPITLLPWHGSPTTVQSDMYRPAEASNQTVLFSSNRLDPSEMYTITVTKTNASLHYGVNIDAFILTLPDGPGTNSSASALISASL